MNTPESSLARRGFLRMAGIAGVGLGFNLQRCIAGASLSRADAAEAKAAMMPSGEIIVGLDIGTSKVRVLVGERQFDDTMKVLGVGRARSFGILSGEVVDSEAAAECVREALMDAEMKTDVMIGETHLAVFGAPDIHRVGGRIKHCVRCVNAVGVEVGDIALRPLTSARAVLDSDQEKLGALVIDMGAGTTSYIVLADNQFKGWGVCDLGGDHITNDLSRGLRISMASAERLKREEGSVWPGSAMPGGRIVIEEPDGVCKEVERETLYSIIRCRVREIFDRMKAHIETKEVRFDSLAAGVHLTGGGSMLRGIDGFAQDVFGIPAHLARAKGINWGASAPESPEYSCATGLLKLGAIRRANPGDTRRRYFLVIPKREA